MGVHTQSRMQDVIEDREHRTASSAGMGPKRVWQQEGPLREVYKRADSER